MHSDQSNTRSFLFLFCYSWSPLSSIFQIRQWSSTTLYGIYMLCIGYHFSSQWYSPGWLHSLEYLLARRLAKASSYDDSLPRLGLHLSLPFASFPGICICEILFRRWCKLERMVWKTYSDCLHFCTRSLLVSLDKVPCAKMKRLIVTMNSQECRIFSLLDCPPAAKLDTFSACTWSSRLLDLDYLLSRFSSDTEKNFHTVEIWQHKSVG